MDFKKQIETYLAPLPSEWRKKLTTLLCEINSSQQTVDCQKVRECETTTSLSPFTTNGSVISIQYKDEKGVTVTRSVDIEGVINNNLSNLDPACLADDVQWSNMDLTERLQLLIDSHCDCCNEE